jgi:5'-phosphate synthase pdxT subunit
MNVSQPIVGVLALQGDVREHLHMLASVGADPRPIRTTDELNRVDGLVLPGGESTTIWRLTRAFGLLEQLRRRVSNGMPTYGSCAGMIMLADRLEDGTKGQETIGGMDITVRRNAFGRQVDSFESELDIPAIGEGGALHAVFIRAPWVEKVGLGVEILARVTPQLAAASTAPHASANYSPASTAPHASANYSPASTAPHASAGRIVAVRQGPLLATSFHPELTADVRMHAFFLDMVKEA